jgi:2-succinyl-5-enolpyruvyl-6-hydroxy-3-cyclohexene-1-carboxylate synthase
LNCSTKLAQSILRQLIELGIKDFVVCSGSRNAPFLIALGEAYEKQLIDLHTKIDERGAAFFALGIAKASNNYAAVICTSGTAAANLHPAALEALHNNSKLLIITADRPAHLRNTGANQTANQVNIYSGIKTHDISSSINMKPLLINGPIHLNVQFDEPLVSEKKIDWLSCIKIIPENYYNKIGGKLKLSVGVLIIGHDRAGYSVEEINIFAEKLKWPVIAEDPISFPQAIAHAAIFLSDHKIASKLKTENIVVIGRTTLSKSINSFIKLCANLVVIDPRVADVYNRRKANLILTSLPTQLVTGKNDLTLWQKASEIASCEIENIIWSEQLAIMTICKLIPDGSALFVGLSRPIRDVESFAKPRKGLHVFSNRGLSGIDGNISTIFGIAKKFESTFAIIGDLTFLHDVSALANKSGENIRIFVIDNNGGGIFSTLPQASVDNFDQLFGTPHNLDLGKVAAAFGVNSFTVNDLAGLQLQLIRQLNGLEVIIIKVPSRSTNANNLKKITYRVSKAVRIGINLD